LTLAGVIVGIMFIVYDFINLRLPGDFLGSPTYWLWSAITLNLLFLIDFCLHIGAFKTKQSKFMIFEGFL
jgi:hypothetical protein